MNERARNILIAVGIIVVLLTFVKVWFNPHWEENECIRIANPYQEYDLRGKVDRVCLRTQHLDMAECAYLTTCRHLAWGDES